MEQSVLHCINELKASITSRAGVPANEVKNMVKLREIIIRTTGNYISLIVLLRLFEFEPAKFPPSTYNLDLLSDFCGYDNWKAFCETHQKKAAKSE